MKKIKNFMRTKILFKPVRKRNRWTYFLNFFPHLFGSKDVVN